jgi:hypothetical protein
MKAWTAGGGMRGLLLTALLLEFDALRSWRNETTTGCLCGARNARGVHHRSAIGVCRGLGVQDGSGGVVVVSIDVNRAVAARRAEAQASRRADMAHNFRDKHWYETWMCEFAEHYVAIVSPNGTPQAIAEEYD